ncbi:pentapeptide repeat-containing protein [Streptomyces hirsutus]|uniref:pentapeptide repeat-containing protein n=1 Tax=Streptomyces hirsutus TaxID=35620 RepID=UPI00362930EF
MAIFVVTGVTTWALIATNSPSTADEARISSVRINAIRTGLSVGVGAGGVIALGLATRKQWLGERSQAHQEEVAMSTIMDATERRITDLYGKAVDQLGSEKPAVRIGGILALERLAQANEGHRQTVADVLCAYLRMPLAIPEHVDFRTANPFALQSAIVDESIKQEVQVRITAQSILKKHLYRDAKKADDFWRGIKVDLTGATLITLDFSECELGGLRCANARFLGTTRLAGCSFDETSNFRNATFCGHVDLDRAVFKSGARFINAEFQATASFLQAIFTCGIRCDEAKFGKEVHFRGAEFGKIAAFDRAVFAEGAVFSECEFYENGQFTGAEFYQRAMFRRALFHGPAVFSAATFLRAVQFGDSLFEGRVRFHGTSFHGPIGFVRARFNRELSFREIAFDSHVKFGDAHLGYGAHFRKVKFKEGVTFDGNRNSGESVFFSCAFEGPTRFCNSKRRGVRFIESYVESERNLVVHPVGWLVSPVPTRQGKFEIIRWRPPLALP